MFCLNENKYFEELSNKKNKYDYIENYLKEEKEYNLDNKFKLNIGIYNDTEIFIKCSPINELPQYIYCNLFTYDDIQQKEVLTNKKLKEIYKLIIKLIELKQYYLLEENNNIKLHFLLNQNVFEILLEQTPISIKNLVTYMQPILNYFQNEINTLKKQVVEYKQINENLLNENKIKESKENITTNYSINSDMNCFSTKENTFDIKLKDNMNDKNIFAKTESCFSVTSNNTTIVNNLNEEKVTFDIMKKNYDIILDSSSSEINCNDKSLKDEGFEDLCSLYFDNLNSLYLKNNQITNLNPLKNFNLKLSTLRKLFLSHNQIKSIEPLKKARLNSLQILFLDNNYIEDFSDLCCMELRDLALLILNNNQINDVCFLKNLKCSQLHELNIAYNNIRDINILSGINFPKLKFLYMSNNRISDISVFKSVKLPELEKLTLFNNDVNNIDVFKERDLNFKNLKLISIGNYVKDLTPLKDGIFPCLMQLIFSPDMILSIDCLTEINSNNLIRLSLYGNQIKDINCLSHIKFKNLEILDLGRNDINDISVLQECKFENLKELNLSENHIEEIDVFCNVRFKKLYKLAVGNDLKDIFLFKEIKEKYLKQLTELYLNNNNFINKNEIKTNDTINFLVKKLTKFEI